MSRSLTRTVRSTVSSPNLRTKQPARNDNLAKDNVRNLAHTLLLNQAQTMTKNAISVDRKSMYFFQRKRSGRQCTCLNEDSSPNGECQICFKVGYVGGYDKYATITEYVESAKDLVLVNCRRDFTTRPVSIILDDDNTTGYIYGEVELRKNVGIVDLVQFGHSLNLGTKVETFIKSEIDSSYVAYDETVLKNKLVNKKIFFKIKLSRDAITTKSPVFSHLMFRYNLKPTVTVDADWPIVNDTIALGEFGVFDSWQTATINLTPDVKVVGTEDFFIKIEDMRRWKLIEEKNVTQIGILNGHEITVRLVQPYEPYSKIP